MGAVAADRLIQGALGFDVPAVVVVRARPDGLIECRWPARLPDGGCMCFPDWATALARLPAVCAWLGVPYILRVRR